jgi:hypothetical protein
MKQTQAKRAELVCHSHKWGIQLEIALATKKKKETNPYG